MNVLFISHLYPNSLEPGKAPFHRGLVHALAQRATVEVIAPVFRRPGRKLPPEEEIIDGVTVRHPRIWYVPGVFVHQHWRMYRTSMRRKLRAQIAEFKPDHVLIGYLYPDGAALGSLCKELGIPYSIRVAGSDFRVRYKQPKFRDTVLRTLQDAPLIFTHGNALKRDIEAALRNAGPRDSRTRTKDEDDYDSTATTLSPTRAVAPTLDTRHSARERLPYSHTPIQSLLTPDTRGAKVVAVYNGVDHKIFFRRYRKEAREILSASGLPDEATSPDARREVGTTAKSGPVVPWSRGPVVLFVGNLVDVKAPERILHALVHAFINALMCSTVGSARTPRPTCAVKGRAKPPAEPQRIRHHICDCKDLALTNKTGEKVHLALIGSGPLKNKLQRLAEKLGIADHVQFLGQLPQDQVALWMNAADCLVLPSKSEGTPNVVLEALACGTPVVATPVGEVPELVHDGENGYVTDDIADGLSKVCDHEWDRETIAAGVAGFTWEATAETILTAVDKA